MVRKTHRLLWNILFQTKKLGASGVLHDSGLLVLLLNVKSTCGGLLYLVKFYAANLHPY